MCEEEDNSWQVVMVMQDASLVSISPPGNLMFVLEVGSVMTTKWWSGIS